MVTNGCFLASCHTHTQTYLLYVQAGDIQMDDAPLQTVHHTIAVVMGQEVPHDGRGQVTEAVGDNVRLQRLQEGPLSNRVLHQPSIQLAEQQVAAIHTHTHTHTDNLIFTSSSQQLSNI